MKTKLLTLLIFVLASVFYSCTKESDQDCTSTVNQDNALTISERRIIVSNCGGHAGCHSTSRVMDGSTLGEVNLLLKAGLDPVHNLSVCERSKLQTWFNSETGK